MEACEASRPRTQAVAIHYIFNPEEEVTTCMTGVQEVL